MRVLVVAYYFPPIGGGGVNRSLRVVRALCARGARPVVLTVDGAAWAQDPELLEAVPPEVRVLRLPNPDWGRVAARRLAESGAEAPRAAGRLRRYLVPDLHVGWSALAAPSAALFAATRAVDLVYTSGPPYSAHAAGLLARAAGVPWVADFRDAWLDCPTRGDWPPWRQRLERRMEELVLRSADHVLFASDAARERAVARWPGIAQRCQSVLTGWDAREFAPTPGVAPAPGRLEIVHAGSLRLNHMDEGLARALEAFARWCAREPGVRRTVRVGLVGAEPEIAARLERAGVSDWVRVEPRLPRAGLARRIRRAHVALAFAATSRFGGDPIPGKVFDAVGADRFLLALTPPGGLADLVRRRGLGAALDPRDGEGLLALLSDLRRRALAGQPIPGPPETSRAALCNERAMARILAAFERVGPPRTQERRTCPNPCP